MKNMIFLLFLIVLLPAANLFSNIKIEDDSFFDNDEIFVKLSHKTIPLKFSFITEDKAWQLCIKKAAYYSLPILEELYGVDYPPDVMNIDESEKIDMGREEFKATLAGIYMDAWIMLTYPYREELIIHELGHSWSVINFPLNFGICWASEGVTILYSELVIKRLEKEGIFNGGYLYDNYRNYDNVYINNSSTFNIKLCNEEIYIAPPSQTEFNYFYAMGYRLSRELYNLSGQEVFKRFQQLAYYIIKRGRKLTSVQIENFFGMYAPKEKLKEMFDRYCYTNRSVMTNYLIDASYYSEFIVGKEPNYSEDAILEND